MPSLRQARRAVALTFWISGVVLASWISRVPALRDAFDLSGAQLGLLLLCLSLGAVIALPASGPAVHRFGPRGVVAGATVVVGLGSVAVAAGIALDAVAVTAAGLVLAGSGNGAWDVAMNVEGADVERRVGRPIMPRLHGWFSVGTVVGAGIGAGAAALGVPLAVQLVLVTPLSVAVVLLAVRSFRSAAQSTPVRTLTPAGDTGPRASSGAGRAWRESRTLLIGLMTLAFAFTEGTANDWVAVALVDGYHVPDAVGAAAFGAFVTAMTAGRLFGGVLMERFGRVPVLRGSAVLALLGVLLVVAGDVVAGGVVLAFGGALLWGLGAALGFPAGMSAAADDPAAAAARVSVVSSVAYTAFIAGPTVIGPLTDAVGMPEALLVVLVGAALALAASGAAQPLGPPAARDATQPPPPS